MAIVLPLVYVQQEKMEEKKKEEMAQYAANQQIRQAQINQMRYVPQSAPAVTVYPGKAISLSKDTGNGDAGTLLTLYGEGFNKGSSIYFFIESLPGVDLFKTVQPISVEDKQIVFQAPKLGSGAYTVGVVLGTVRSNGVLYSVMPDQAPPATVDASDILSVSWNLQPDFGTYYNTRMFIADWDGELVPANDDASATAWCKLVPHQNYTKGTSHTNGTGTPENLKYKWNGSGWTRLINGDYPRYYHCM